MGTTIFPTILGSGGRTVARPTAVERKSSWWQTAAVILTIVGSVFVAGREVGSENAQLRAEVSETNKSLNSLDTSVVQLTNATTRSTNEQVAQRQWLIRMLQALTDSLSAGERNRRLREIASEMQRQGRNMIPSPGDTEHASGARGMP